MMCIIIKINASHWQAANNLYTWHLQVYGTTVEFVLMNKQVFRTVKPHTVCSEEIFFAILLQSINKQVEKQVVYARLNKKALSLF